MKRILTLVLAAALLLALSSVAFAEEGVELEIVKLDGVSVVVLTPAQTMRGRNVTADRDAAESAFVLPAALTAIEKSAFEGIDATCVEISDNVVVIGSRAFADCANLRELHLSESVQNIALDALAGCEDVTVYGSTLAAKLFAELNGFIYVDESAVVFPLIPEKPPVVLPFVRAD